MNNTFRNITVTNIINIDNTTAPFETNRVVAYDCGKQYEQGHNPFMDIIQTS